MPGRAVPERNQRLIEFGARVRELRESQRLSQEQLAHAAGLHRTVVGFIERDDREVGLSTVWALAAALEVPVEELFIQGLRIFATGGEVLGRDLGGEGHVFRGTVMRAAFTVEPVSDPALRGA